MSTYTKRARLASYLKGLNVSWWTVGAWAVVLAFANGFLLTTLQGAVGAVERHQAPFDRWIKASLLMTPIYLVGVVVALILARRWVGGQKSFIKGTVSVLLVIVMCAAIGTAEASVSAAYDYSLQKNHIAFEHNLHAAPAPAAGSLDAQRKCDAVCNQERNTIMIHFKAVSLLALVMLLADLVMAPWVLALCRGRLWITRKPTPSRVIEAAAAPAMA